MLVQATQMSTKVAARLGGKLIDVASRAQGVNRSQQVKVYE